MLPDAEFIALSRMLYPEIFRSLEHGNDLPWDAFDGTLLFARTFISVEDLNCFPRETTVD